MSLAVSCALLLCLALCSAELPQNILQVQETEYPVFETTEFSLGGASSQDVGVLGLLQQFDLTDEAENTQQSFTVWPTTSFFFDSNWQSWVDQQFTVLDSLKGVLVSGCPHAALATPPQSDYPSLLSYMASSRFGPATLTAYARQVDQDLQPAGFSFSTLSSGADLDNVLDEPDWTMADWAPEEEEEPEPATLDSEFGTIFGSAFRPRSLDVSSLFGAQQDAVVSAVPEDETSETQQLFQSAEWDPNTMQADTVEPPEVLAWGDACNFILFIGLCIGCIFVWIGLIRAWISCCHLEDQAKIRSAASQQLATNPLLAPLIPEGITKNPAFTGVEVAADHSPSGSFMAPSGSQFTTIAYMPLPSEMQK